MSAISVLLDDGSALEGTADGERLLLSAAGVAESLGWVLKPEGLCRADLCLLVSDRPHLQPSPGSLDARALCELVGRALVTDLHRGVAAISAERAVRDAVLKNSQAVPFELPDLDGRIRSLEEWAGKKKLLVCWASW